MLRFLGFMTGSALTAALALAIVDPVTLESLRRSAATLFLGVDPAAPAATQLAQPASPDADVPRTPTRPLGDVAAVRSRLLAALPGRDPREGDAAVAGANMRPGTGASQPSTGTPGTDPMEPETVRRETAAAPGAAAPDAGAVAASEPVTGHGLTAGRNAGDPASWSDVAATGASPAESSLDDWQAAQTAGADAGEPGTASFNVGPGQVADLADLADQSFDPTTPGAADDDFAYARGSAQPETEPAPPTPDAGSSSPAASAPGTTPGGTVAEFDGSPLGDLPPPAGAGDAGGWHAFWTPFHSEASASGFARHLERATGESYRVVRTGPGAYRVAFWHEGDDERSRRLMAIEQASGLRLRGGTL